MNTQTHRCQAECFVPRCALCFVVLLGHWLVIVVVCNFSNSVIPHPPNSLQSRAEFRVPDYRAFAFGYYHQAFPKHQRWKHNAAQIQHLGAGSHYSCERTLARKSSSINAWDGWAFHFSQTEQISWPWNHLFPSKKTSNPKRRYSLQAHRSDQTKRPNTADPTRRSTDQACVRKDRGLFPTARNSLTYCWTDSSVSWVELKGVLISQKPRFVGAFLVPLGCGIK